MSKRDPKYMFRVNEDRENQQVFYFNMGEQGKPQKLGDGTYGVVFKVISPENEDLAIKILYDQVSRSSEFDITIDSKSMKKLAKRLKLTAQATEGVIKVAATAKSIFDVSIGLKKLELTDMQFESLLEQVQHKSRVETRQRYKHEMQSASKIREELNNRGQSHAFAGVITILGGTENFRNSKAFGNLKGYFDSSQMSVSNYAIVMPMYEWTLKDLLENGTRRFILPSSAESAIFKGQKTPPPQLIDLADRPMLKNSLEKQIDQMEKIDEKDRLTLKKHITELTGYELIKTMGFKERLAMIMPYLLDISQGIMALHLANLFHYDLKPANIFVRRRGREVESVIGDLGFLMVQNLMSSIATNLHDVLPLGTRHYRSPEQKDYFDICDVEILESGQLKINDPKFQDSIIEQGDFVVFSRDSKRIKHHIKKIEKNHTVTMVTLKDNNAGQPDARTHAVFYKEQEVRTDLFGFGAIVFDLLTGGKSPERFYDKIRTYDDEKYDIDQIMDAYKQVSSYQVSDPGLTHIFSDFKQAPKPDYAHSEVVELILKCMLYKTENTFYQEFVRSSESDDKYKAMEAVFEKLQSIGKTLASQQRMDNLLFSEIIPGAEKKGESKLLNEKIATLQEMEEAELPLRLSQAVWYFKQLVSLLRDTIANKGSSQFFTELRPVNIIVNPENPQNTLGFMHIAYQREESYENDLKEDLVYVKITRNIENPFVPNYLSFLRRTIALKLISKEALEFKYLFSTAAIFGDTIRKGDWILLDGKLCEVKNVSAKTVTLSPKNKSNYDKLLSSFKENFGSSTEHIFYKNLDPCYYYLNMLGIYAYHLFFVGLGQASKDKPLYITIAQSSSYLPDIQDHAEIRENHVNTAGKNVTINDIYNFIIDIYLKLTFPGDSRSYYKSSGFDTNRIISVSRDVARLQTMIERFIEVEETYLDRLQTELKLEKRAIIQKKVLNGLPGNLEFDHLARSFLSFSLAKKRKRLERWDKRLTNVSLKVFSSWRNSHLAWLSTISAKICDFLEAGKLKTSYVLLTLGVILLFASITFWYSDTSSEDSTNTEEPITSQDSSNASSDTLK